MGRPLTEEQRRKRAQELGILIDPEDDDLIRDYTWRISTKGYVETYLDGTTYKLHHFVIGKPPEGMQVDHENRNKRDNRRTNLRFKDAHSNIQNSDRVENAKHIRILASGAFQVRVQRFDQMMCKSVPTLEEAVKVRDEFIRAVPAPTQSTSGDG